MFERLTHEARSAVVRAQARAGARGGREVTCVDLLQALAEPESPVADLLAGHGLTPDAVTARDGDAEALRTLGIDLEAIRDAVETSFGPGAMDAAARRGGRRPFARRTKKALELSLRETIRLHGGSIGAATLVLGVLRADDPDVTRWLGRQVVDLAALRAELEPLAREAA